MHILVLKSVTPNSSYRLSKLTSICTFTTTIQQHLVTLTTGTFVASCQIRAKLSTRILHTLIDVCVWGVWDVRVCEMWGCVRCEGVWDVKVCEMWGCVRCEGVWDVRGGEMWRCVRCDGVWDVRVCEMWGCVRCDGVCDVTVCAIRTMDVHYYTHWCMLIGRLLGSNHGNIHTSVHPPRWHTVAHNHDHHHILTRPQLREGAESQVTWYTIQ